VGTVPGMSYPRNLTDEQWQLVEPVFNVPEKRGRKHGGDLRSVGGRNALHLAHRSPVAVPAGVVRTLDSGVVTVPALVTQRHVGATVLHAAAREAAGRSEPTPSMVVIDTHLPRGASNGGFTFHDRGGPYGRTKGAKRVVAVDVAGLPVGAVIVPASCHENRTTELMLDHLRRQGVIDRHELVMVDRGVAAAAARALGRHHDLELRRVGWNDSSRCSAPSGTLGASRWPTAGSDVHAGWRRRSRTAPLSDRLAPSRLHRDHPASPVADVT
jgi:putative transposase